MARRKKRSQVAKASQKSVQTLKAQKAAKEEEIQPYVEKCVVHAVHSFADAEKRWGEYRKRGLTHEELRGAVGFELGIQGGNFGMGLRYGYKGGSNPQVTAFLNGSWSEKRIIKGAALLQMVRRLLQIPGREVT